MNPDEPQNPVIPDANQPVQPIQSIQPMDQSLEFIPPPPETPVPVEQPIQALPYTPTQPVQPIGQSMEFVPPPPETPVPVEQPIQMPPYAPAQPPVLVESPAPDPVAPPAIPTVPASPQPANNKTDTLGIISIICGLIGVFPIGLILGLVGASRAKKAQRSAVLSRIGWIFSLVVMLVAIPVVALLVLDNFESAQTKARDTERISDTNSIHVGLEDFFNNNFGYPNKLDDIKLSSEQSLIGPNGTTIKVNEVAADEDEAKASTDPTGDAEYTYTPYGKPTCTTTCDGYVLKSFIEKPTPSTLNPYVKLGLENL